MGKGLMKNANGDIHIGVEYPEGFTIKTTKKDVEKLLASLGKRKLWRCTVCNDLNISTKPPKECPTCQAIEAYVEITNQEFMTMMAIV